MRKEKLLKLRILLEQKEPMKARNKKKRKLISDTFSFTLKNSYRIVIEKSAT